MPVAETVLIYGVIPLGIVALLAILTFGPAVTHRRPHWKSGQAWPHEPVWYEPHPIGGEEHGEGDGHAALGTGSHAALGTGAHAALTQGPDADAERARAAGPLGGARGTW